MIMLSSCNRVGSATIRNVLASASAADLLNGAATGTSDAEPRCTLRAAGRVIPEG